MSGDVRAGLAQWTPDSDPGVNLRTVGLFALVGAPYFIYLLRRGGS